MSENFLGIFFLLGIIAFLTAVFMHLVRRSRSLVRLYALQSFAVSMTFFLLGFLGGDRSLMLVAAAIIFLVKVIIAPAFFGKILRKLSGSSSTNNYLSTPMTLLVLTGLVLFSFSKVFLPLSAIYPQAFVSVALNIALVFISIFLLINRRGVFAQMVGMLSLENSIVLFAAFFGLRHPLPLEIGMIFDIVIWMVIASFFLGMIYRQFGTLSTADMKRLTE
ncbi:MAG: hydrogenase-4 component [Patescibacteria group bacterium]|nr:hydrogenase-4 component [Patescibacteria group bacterium]